MRIELWAVHLKKLYLDAVINAKCQPRTYTNSQLSGIKLKLSWMCNVPLSVVASSDGFIHSINKISHCELCH